ncbi:MAG: hypothetical protein FWC10_04960, partial [Lentimicrobiaceae bacterium]|nr:hypothetical protein [Lentimicrobiaceae bacterium]
MTKIKKISFFLFITLSFNSLCFSQSANSYIDIITGNSEKYVPFQKNFNPRKYDPAILKSCFITMMDDIRHQLYGCKAFINLPMLDSVALMQAEFQAAKDNLTTQNEAPFQRTAQRLKKYGFSTQGNEIVGKAKAHQGDNDYSYYDLCLELMKPLLKTSSGVPAMLSPQYTIYGFACDIDRNLRFLYISFVQGNDLTNQVFNSIASKQKDIPISKGNAGLSFYEETVCKKCAEDQTLELVYDMLYWDENGDVFLQSDDAKLVKRLLTKAGSFIVLDFIQKEQYNCRVPQVDHNKPFRGIVSKPISVDKILAANDSTVKSNMFHAKIGAIPPQIELSKEIDINILLLSDKKVVCRTLIKKKIQNLKTSDALADSLIEAQEFEKALYRLSPMLSDSTINEQALFAIVRLAAHKEKNYLSSIFTQSVQMANLRNP